MEGRTGDRLPLRSLSLDREREPMTKRTIPTPRDTPADPVASALAELAELELLDWPTLAELEIARARDTARRIRRAG